MKRALLIVAGLLFAASLVYAAGESEQAFGISLSTLNNPFFVTLRDGAQRASDELGVDLIVVDSLIYAEKLISISLRSNTLWLNRSAVKNLHMAYE